MPPSSGDEDRKKAIFDGMSPKRKEQILKRGYYDWDPFAPPKDPLDMRMDRTRHTAAMLVKAFLSTCLDKDFSSAYLQGVREICVGIINEDERYRAMYEFSIWYRGFLKEKDRRDQTGAR